MGAVDLAAVQTSLHVAPIASVEPMPIETANVLLDRWGHQLGPVRRPFRSEPWALNVDGVPVALAVSCSIVSPQVEGYGIQEVVELARLCAAPAAPWANRVLLRLWRELLAPRWQCWPVKAAVSYSVNALHRGDIYRFDGWEKVRTNAGSRGGGTWSAKRVEGEAQHGSKTLWIWRYDKQA